MSAEVGVNAQAAVAAVSSDIIEQYQRKVAQLRSQRNALKADVAMLQDQAERQQATIEDLIAQQSVQCRGASRRLGSQTLLPSDRCLVAPRNRRTDLCCPSRRCVVPDHRRFRCVP